ncbi:hypothetical protein [Flagellimonas sp.]|uniref:hypothetical protein n=1 Tax=Flagellimonas sp. TaxID=2058762 RepID=UPI003F49FE40
MGTTELLRYLEKLEIGLSSFSYEELSTSEAGELKKTFNEFKNGLEDKVFGVDPIDELEVIYEEIGISKPKKVGPSDYKSTLGQVALLLKKFDVSELSLQHKRLLEEIKQLAHASQESFEGNYHIEKTFVPNTIEQVDLQPLWEECMQQMDLMEELARLYKQNIFEFVGKIKVNLQSKNVRGMDFSCQKVGQSLRMMRCHTLLEITEQMSKICKSDNDLKHLNFLYQEFLMEYPKVQEALDKKMEALRKA